ncbi:MAG: glycine cleavage system protein GcvH [Candidatus Cloacimonetes bacterium]|nr:glycine cleavage system protein GcvH [Candidatus Cloacimonadota bacterium]
MTRKELYYSETHEWVKVEGKDAYIGLTDYAQKELGDIVYVELPEEGDKLSASEPFGSVEAVKAVEDIIAPVSGEVLKVNVDLEDKPELVNKSPFEDGWFLKIKLTNAEEIENLMTAEEYKEFIEDDSE